MDRYAVPENWKSDAYLGFVETKTESWEEVIG